MYVENDGLVAVISFYLYGLTGLSLLVLISPLIIVAVPLLIMLGPVAIAWWRGRRMAPRIGFAARWWLMAASVVVLAAPVVPAVWFLIDNTDGAPKESFWLLVFELALLLFTLAATIYAIRWQGASGHSVVEAPHSGTQ